MALGQVPHAARHGTLHVVGDRLRGSRGRGVTGALPRQTSWRVLEAFFGRGKS